MSVERDLILIRAGYTQKGRIHTHKRAGYTHIFEISMTLLSILV